MCACTHTHMNILINANYLIKILWFKSLDFFACRCIMSEVYEIIISVLQVLLMVCVFKTRNFILRCTELFRPISISSTYYNAVFLLAGWMRLGGGGGNQGVRFLFFYLFMWCHLLQLFFWKLLSHKLGSTCIPMLLSLPLILISSFSQTNQKIDHSVFESGSGNIS